MPVTQPTPHRRSRDEVWADVASFLANMTPIPPERVAAFEAEEAATAARKLRAPGRHRRAARS